MPRSIGRLGAVCLHDAVALRAAQLGAYLDLENPAFMVQNRLRTLVGGDDPQPIPLLKFWGEWDCEVSVPHSGSELLLTICKETQPLVIIDPFIYFHSAKENDASEMANVMQYFAHAPLTDLASSCSIIRLRPKDPHAGVHQPSGGPAILRSSINSTRKAN